MSKVTRWAKRVQHSTSETLGDLRSFAAGYRHFKKNGVTPPEAYTSMRRLYRKTNGRFNDAMGNHVRLCIASKTRISMRAYSKTLHRVK